jgi:hypothetical protein
MRALLLALALVACGDNTVPETPGPTPDGPTPDTPVAPPVGPCVDQPTDLPLPPTGALACDLLPPTGFNP